MFDLVHKHKRIIQVILTLTMVPFAFFGVDYYFRSGDSVGEIATFDGGRITEAEFAQSIREQQENLRRSAQGVDPAIFDNPEVRFNLLQQMVRERLVEKKGADLHFQVSNAEVFDRIAADPRFRQGDRFSLDVYKNLLRQAGIPEPAFEESIRRQILSERIVDPISRGGVVPRASGVAFVNLVEQQREVEVANFEVEPFVKDVTVDSAQEKAFYDANAAAFKSPEEAKFEYVVLTQEALLAQIAVTPDEVRAQYENAAQELPPGGAAAGVPHPDRGKARRQRGRARGGEEDRRGAGGAGEGESRRNLPILPGNVRRIRARRRRAGISGAIRAARW